MGHGVAKCLKHCAVSPKVSGSIPGGVTLGISSVATDGTMCLGSTQRLKVSTRISTGVKAAGA
jgi:hypothetical protein